MQKQGAHHPAYDPTYVKAKGGTKSVEDSIQSTVTNTLLFF